MMMESHILNCLDIQFDTQTEFRYSLRVKLNVEIGFEFFAVFSVIHYFAGCQIIKF